MTAIFTGRTVRNVGFRPSPVIAPVVRAPNVSGLFGRAKRGYAATANYLATQGGDILTDQAGNKLTIG